MRINIANFAVLLMPFGLIMLSLGGAYGIVGGLIFASYLMVFVVPVLQRADIFRLNKHIIPAIIVFLFVGIGYARSVLNGNFYLFKMIGLMVIWAGIIIGLSSWSRRGVPIIYCWRGVQAYVAINVIGMFMQIPPPSNAYSDTGSATILGVFGISASRVLFPFALGVNGFGVIAGLATITGAIYFLWQKNTSSGLFFLLCLLGLMLSDSRGALAATLATMGVLGLAVVLRRSIYSLRVMSTSIALIYPALTFLIYSSVELVFGDVSAIVRAGGDVFSGRDIIWVAAFDRIQTFDLWNFVFGWGYLGQMPSGVSEGYEKLFQHLDLNPEQMNVHSSALQLFLNYGIVGVLGVVYVLMSWAKSSAMMIYNSNIQGYMLFGFMCYAVLVGAVDLTFNENNLVFFYCLLIHMAWQVVDNNSDGAVYRRRYE